MDEDIEPIYGAAPEGWAYSTPGLLESAGACELQTGPFGTMLHASAYLSSGTPVVAVKNIGENRLILDAETPRIGPADAERLGRYRLRRGDIVFGRKGAVDRRAYATEADEEWIQGSDCLRLRFVDEVVEPRFVSHVLGTQAYKDWILRHSQGATMPSLNQEILRRIPLPLPSLAEQRRIARILGALDDKIELNRRTNETLDAMARALFRAWFVDFEPVRAKQDGRRLDPLSQKYLHLFPDRLVDTEHGEIPEGWEWGVLRDVVELHRGTTYDSKKKGQPGPYLLGLASIQRNGGFRDDSLVTYGGESPSRILVAPGDLFLSLKDVTQAADLLGAVARVPADIASGRLTQDTVRLALRGGIVSSGRLYWELRTEEYRDYCRSHATGTTNLGLSREDFLGYPLCVAPVAIEEAFLALETRLENASAANRLESQTLAALRDGLRPQLLSGEVATA